MNRDEIEQYADGGRKLEMAVRGLTPADMDATPGPGEWSTHQVVIHLADAEAAMADRVRRLVATENPTLHAWDENAFMANLHYGAQSAADAVTVVDLTRRQVARVLRQLPDAAFDRAGTHTQAGRMTLADVVKKANDHLHHHLKFIADKRERLGKLMW